MPLIVPGLSSKSSNPTETWMTKLMGKTLHDSKHDETNFSRKELPQNHRVIAPDTMSTADYQPDRLNVHVGKDGIVQKVTHG